MSIQTEYDAKTIGKQGLARLARMVDRGYEQFWRRRGMKPPSGDFRELVRNGAREGAAMRKGRQE